MMTDLDLRMIDYQLSTGVMSIQVVNPWRGCGYFTDREQVLEIVAEIEEDESVVAIYTGLNPGDGPIGFRRQCAVWLTNGQIPRRRRVLLDADLTGSRLPGQSSTDAEHAAAHDRGESIRQYLRAAGVSPNSLAAADSANGDHTVIFCDWICDDHSDRAIVGLVAGISAKFSDAAVSIDTTVTDRRRVTKVYGSTSRKGSNTPERPWRRSHVLAMPELADIVPAPIEVIEQIAASLGTSAPAVSAGDGIARPAAVEKFIRRFFAYCEKVGVAVTNTRTLPGGKVLIDTEPCLLHSDHAGAVGITADGIRCVQCFHARCSIGWGKWRRAVEAKYKVPMCLEGKVKIGGNFKRQP